MLPGRDATPNPWRLTAQAFASREDSAREVVERIKASVGPTIRPKQLPPEGDWFVWLLRAGRGFGKTRTGAEWFNAKARQGRRGDQMLLAGRTPADVRDYALNGEGGLLTHHPDIRYEPSKRLLTWPNGVVAVIRSGANPEEFRGFSGEVAWLDEFAAWRYPELAWNNLIFGTRERNPQICITTTPRSIQVLRTIMEMPTTIDVVGSSDENRANLSDKWFRAVIEPLRGTRLGRREIGGEMVDDSEAAHWDRAWIEEHRWVGADGDPRPVPSLVRIVVAVDPQGKKRDVRGRETGIVVAGLGRNGEFYVLDDLSINGTPAEWGGEAVKGYDAWEADRIVGEVNYGGDMVEATIRAVRENVSYGEVRATRGKARRAEPIAALYQRGKVHHVGTFAEMEDEMCTWSEEETWSPNRMDALVWALTELHGPEEEPAKKVYTKATWGN